MEEATKFLFPISLLFEISIHASRGGSDTPLLTDQGRHFDFNPRFPWGKRQPTGLLCSLPTKFQSTLPVGEATRAWRTLSTTPQLFQSTLPVGEATRLEAVSERPSAISIHASRGGSDRRSFRFPERCRYFNPRFPWGKRQEVRDWLDDTYRISIHASRGGSDHSV